MYERFTDRARKVMQLANEEAQRLNHEYIGTEHILLGLVKEGLGVAAYVLKNLNVDLQKIRLEVEKINQTRPGLGHMAQTPHAKKVIEYAIEALRDLGHNYVGTEHLLLGLVRVEECVAAQVLANLGLRPDMVRADVYNILGHNINTVDVCHVGETLERAIKDREREILRLLPAEVREEVGKLDQRIAQLNAEKEGAVASQDFYKAAVLRDQTDELHKKRSVLVREMARKQYAEFQRELSKINLQISQLQQEKEDAVAAGEFEKAADRRDQLDRLRKQREIMILESVGIQAVGEDLHFTDRARKVMQLANQEAQRFNHDYIGTEHILLGLMKEGTGIAAVVLQNLDIDLRRIRLEIEKIVQSGKLPQMPRVKKVIEYAIDEASSLGHKEVGTEHLLVGLLREEEGVAAQVLLNVGLKLTRVRDEVLHVLGQKNGGELAARPPTPEEREFDLVQSMSTELQGQVRMMDQEIARLIDEKVNAVAVQDFEKAARLRDQGDLLIKQRKAFIQGVTEQKYAEVQRELADMNSRIEKLEREIEQAVDADDFNKAADLRDQQDRLKKARELIIQREFPFQQEDR